MMARLGDLSIAERQSDLCERIPYLPPQSSVRVLAKTGHADYAARSPATGGPSRIGPNSAVQS